ncbi:MAG: SapC family protein [Burkholderiaceae bacterium]
MLELLNNISHKDLRVITRRGAQWGDDVMSCPVAIDEFRSLQANYPILFQQDAQGQFHPIVLFGLKEGQNLFLDGERWDADYLPLAMQRMPFSIGVAQDEMRMMVDMASPRIGQDGAGEAVFLQLGGNTEFLDRSNSILRTLHEGLQATSEFVQVLVSHRLLEPFVFEVEQPDGSRGELVGFHLIHEERLAALDPSTVTLLHQADFLQPIYMALASLSNLSRLARRHGACKVNG